MEKEKFYCNETPDRRNLHKKPHCNSAKSEGLVAPQYCDCTRQRIQLTFTSNITREYLGEISDSNTDDNLGEISFTWRVLLFM